jgi:hypothetical protein
MKARVKVVLAFLCACIPFILLMGIPTSAYGEDLTSWANTFTPTRNTISSYHFALLTPSGGKVPHFHDHTINVYVESDASEYCKSTTINGANSFWNYNISIVEVTDPSVPRRHLQ